MTEKYWLYLSLWNEHGGQPGLALLSADAGTGKAEFCAKLDGQRSFGCSFVDQRRNILYLCNEVDKIWGVPYETGRIYGYRISPKDGALTELFHYDTYSPNPAYLTQDHSGRFLIVAHHSVGGAIAKLEQTPDGGFAPVLIQREAPLVVYSLNEDGTIRDIADVQKHTQSATSHQHCCTLSPDGRLIAVCDKGDGHLYLYSLDSETGRLTLCSRTPTDVPGARPRYCVFHPTKPYLVLNHEQERDHRMMAASFRYTAEGQAEKVSAVNLLTGSDVVPPGSHYEQQGLAISEDGQTVYTCVNGPNFIGVLSLDDSGALHIIQKAPISGEWPRGLALAPGGKFLFASCLVSGEVISFAVNPDGTLDAGHLAATQRGGTYFAFCKQDTGGAG